MTSNHKICSFRVKKTGNFCDAFLDITNDIPTIRLAWDCSPSSIDLKVARKEITRSLQQMGIDMKAATMLDAFLPGFEKGPRPDSTYSFYKSFDFKSGNKCHVYVDKSQLELPPDNGILSDLQDLTWDKMPPAIEDQKTWRNEYYPQVVEELHKEFNLDDTLISDAFGGFKKWVN